MALSMETGLAGQLNENLHFVRGLIANPRNVASLFPSSKPLARMIAEQVDPTAKGTVLELGPGTGAVTDALLERGVRPGRLTLIEQDAAFVALLRSRFPGVRVREGDALDVDSAVRGCDEPLAAVISGLPLLNFSEDTRIRLLERSLTHLEPGQPFVQLTFGLNSPILKGARWTVRRVGRVYRNIPPATVWVYTRA